MHDASRLVLGCGNFGGIGSAPALFGQGESREEAFALMDAAWAAGIRRFDTADAYGGGRSERWIGAWTAERGRRPFVTTKVFHSVEGVPGDVGLAPERIRKQLRGSLERLGVERVDCYLAHERDPETPLERTVETFAALADEGLVGAFGLSNCSAEEVERAAGVAPLAVVQNSRSLLDRDGGDVLALCDEHGIDFEAFGPLAGGWLAGRYRRGQPPPPGSRMTLRPEGYRHLEADAVHDGLDALGAAARERDVDLPTLALAWLLADHRVARVVLGPRRPAQLEPGLRALSLDLDANVRDELAGYFEVDATT